MIIIKNLDQVCSVPSPGDDYLSRVMKIKDPEGKETIIPYGTTFVVYNPGDTVATFDLTGSTTLRNEPAVFNGVAYVTRKDEPEYGGYYLPKTLTLPAKTECQFSSNCTKWLQFPDNTKPDNTDASAYWSDFYRYITKIYVNYSGTTLGDSVFYTSNKPLSNVTNIFLPNTLIELGDSSFRYCSSLTSIKIPDNVTTIGDYAFYGCSALSSIDIPNGVTSISSYTFYYCDNLTSVTIPDSVTSIGERAFSNCYSLPSIDIPDGVTSIGKYAFYNCHQLEKIEIPKSVTAIGDNVFYNCSNLEEVNIGNGVTSISNYAFYNCKLLPSITIPDSVISIGQHAFYGCSALSSIVISKNVTSIGQHAFYGCSALSSIDIPNGVTSIDIYAFNGCSSLNSINIPESVTEIGNYAFNGCSSLPSIVISKNVTSIGKYAFLGCSSFDSITLPFIGATTTEARNTHFGYIFGASKYSDNDNYVPNSLNNVIITGKTKISAYAFNGCSRLTSVTIPESVTEIGESAFEGCYGLTIYCEAASEPSGWDSSWNPLNCPVVWNCKETDYTEEDYKYVVLNNIKYGLKKDTTIAIIPMQPRRDITKLIITSTVYYNSVKYKITEIGESAFIAYDLLTSIDIPNGVTTIGDYAFFSCYNLTSIKIPASVTTIGKHAFAYSGLTNITFAGTKEQWKNIEKGPNWNYGIPATEVICSDGRVSI